MSYQVLARKWRPKAFTDVVGQQHVLTVLANALSLGRVHHAYLFSGTRGVGKTSIARLLAKGLNCEKEITATPCGECDNCKDIEQGRFIDLLEIDAASRTKVEDTREILDNVQYLPTKGRFKVYLIDEVHMLSRSSFNALLKTLEEPPEHVKFLLATTDPQKLPITILSRCLHLHLSVLDTPLIKQQLLKVLNAEQIQAEDRALQLLAKAANGSMRDALSLTDQSIALGNGQIDTHSVSLMLGILDKAIPFELIEALYQGDGNRLMSQIESAAKQGVDWDNLLTEAATLLHQISLLQIVPSAIGDYSDYEEHMRYLAQHIAPNDIQLFYQILIMARKELIYAPDKRVGIEMSFLRALAFAPKASISSSTSTSRSNVTVAQTTAKPKFQQVKENNPTAQASSRTISVDQPPVLTVDKTTTSTTENESTALSESHIADTTKSILAARQQLIESEQSIKKSKQVEGNQPESSPLVKIKNQSQNNAQIINAQGSVDGESLTDTTLVEETAETYQWQFSEHFTPDQDSSLNAKDMKQAVEHEKTAELNQQLIVEATKLDPWSAEVETLILSPLIKQIAINAYIKQVTATDVELHLRSVVAHLGRNDKNIKRLSHALSEHRGNNISITVIIDDERTHLTPLEVREQIYQNKLTEAKQLITTDDKVAMICQFFEGRIDEKSIRPV